MRHLAIHLGVPHEPDLAWLLNKSAAAAGIKSNCGPLIDAAKGGWGGGRYDPHEGRTRGYRDKKTGEHRHPWIEAAGRERALHARWGLLDEVCGHDMAEQHRAVLVAAYTEERFPPQTDGKLGQLFAVGFLTAAFREAYAADEGTPVDWVVRACARTSRAKVIESMRLQAGALVEVAVRAWRMTEPRARPPLVDEDTERRAEAAARSVEGPEPAEAPRTWAPESEPRGWMSAREGARPCEDGVAGVCMTPRRGRRRECHVPGLGRAMSSGNLSGRGAYETE